MKKIYSWNLNGIRACAKNGFFDWLEHCEGDIILMQEVRAKTEQLQMDWFKPFDYKSFWHPAEKAGYSGVGIYTKETPVAVHEGLGIPTFDCEGRFLALQYQNFVVASAYFPNSQEGGKRLDFKLGYCKAVLDKLDAFRAKGLPVILGGDLNIAHTEIDLANPKQNQENPGFLPGERQWMSEFLSKGYIDTFRVFEQGPGHYSWWSQRLRARERNVGWRIDYHCISNELRPQLKNAAIHPQVMGSDHCPVSVELAL